MADEDEKQEGQNVDEKKGGGKKLLIIGLLAGLIFGGGGAAGYFIFMGGDKGEPEVLEEEIVEEKGPELPDYQYARMDKLQLPVFYNGRVLNYAVMDVSLETIGNDNKMIAVQNVLIVRDALLRHYSINSVGREDNPSIVDFDKLSEKIKEFSNAEAHKDIVTRVIISEARSF